MANISQEVWYENLEKLPDGTYKRKNQIAKAKNGTTLDSHLAESVHQGEIHGFRLNSDKKLEYNNGTEWVEVKGGGYPVNIVKNVSALEGDSQVELMWEDPENVVIDGATIAEWNHTRVVRKVGSFPKHEEDGVIVVNSGVRNQYKNTPYIDTGLTNEVKYFYSMFPTTTEDIVTVSEISRVSAIPTNHDDTTNAPGGKFLLGGTIQQGYFGEVSASELITGIDLASEVGISAGNSQYSDGDWLKFAYQGKILFVPKKPIRNAISWSSINEAGCVDGTTTVVIRGITYKVRLLRGANKNPTGVAAGVINHYSEWNKLMLPIHWRAKNKSWDTPENVEVDVPYWGTDFSDTDLGITDWTTWCQETMSTGLRIIRGGTGISRSNGRSLAGGFETVWRPVLELAE